MGRQLVFGRVNVDYQVVYEATGLFQRVWACGLALFAVTIACTIPYALRQLRDESRISFDDDDDTNEPAPVFDTGSRVTALHGASRLAWELSTNDGKRRYCDSPGLRGATRLAWEMESGSRLKTSPAQTRAGAAILIPLVLTPFAIYNLYDTYYLVPQIEQSGSLSTLEGVVSRYTGGRFHTMTVNDMKFPVDALPVSQGDQVKVWYEQQSKRVFRVAVADRTP
jgi:hypothetical protein